MNSAVLFLVFNRPDQTRGVFEAIRGARPPRLYISADGPRMDLPREKQICDEVRKIATAVDWPCKVKTQFHNRNLGCKHGETSGMNWFFEQEEEGIVLEDDTLPMRGFFDFCEELLTRYRYHEHVFSISGNSYIGEPFTEASYLFSRYADFWGWAGWRRSWESYDVDMAEWPRWRDAGWLQKMAAGNGWFEKFWEDTFNATHAGQIDTWDYQRLFTMWRHNAVSIMPAQNMVANLGFNASATHTRGRAPRWVTQQVPREPTFPLVHPNETNISAEFDLNFGKRVFGIDAVGSAKRAIKKYCLTRA